MTRSLAIFLTLLVYGCGSDVPTESREPFISRIIVRKSETILIGLNRLYPGQFQLRDVSIAADSIRFNYFLSGSFEVSDGFSMEAFLMRKEDVPAIVAGEEVERVWRSGVANSAAWEFGVPQGGDYTFVLDNRVGEAEWKSITSRLVMSWDESVPVLNP